MSLTCLKHVGPQPLLGLPHLRIAARLLQRVERFERELGVDDEMQFAVGQLDEAVGPRAVAERRLEPEGGVRQPVADDRLHPPLAESAARLLVGEHVAQAHHLRGELGDVALRRVDDRQPLVQGLQRLAGALGLLVQPLSEP